MIVWIAATAVGGCCYAFYSFDFKRFQISATNGALGIAIRPKKEHAIARICHRFANVEEYVQSLERSARCTLKRIHRIEDDYDYVMVAPMQNQNRLGWEHWSVCVDHERRVGSLGLLVGSIRFFFASIMLGTIDEYRDKQTGELVCWTSTIVKGKTMRVMWFYQKTSVSKKSLWFHSIYKAVQRCLATRIDRLDLGPSNGNTKMEEVKSKYGFTLTKDWNKEYSENGCDYDGYYIDLAEALSS